MQVNPSEHEIGDDSAIASSSDLRPARSRRRRTDWRLGGRAVSRWDWRVLVGLLIGGGAGILAAKVVAGADGAAAALWSQAALWLGLVMGTAYAVTRSRPAGLFRFRATDLVWGVGLGLGLRLVGGTLGGGGGAAFPSASEARDSLQTWLLTDALPAGILGPFIEEAFFRAALLVTLFQLLRRRSGTVVAAIAAALASAGAFVCLHAAFASLTLVDTASLFAVGATCAILVLLTGRFWGAVILHIFYNVSFLLLVLIGSVLT